MAAKNRVGVAEISRQRIRTTVLVKRLSDYVLGNKDKQTKKPVELTACQVTAALGLLRKTLPDLQAIEMEMSSQVEHIVSAEPMSIEQWEKDNSVAATSGTTESTH